MRTTIDIPDAQRAQLMKLAAERGEKGFSRLVQEALELYLSQQGARDDKIATALALAGTLDAAAADALESSVREIRSRWR